MKDPSIRTLIIERAAHMLRMREPITLRSLVSQTGVSTMAVYTYFGGMDGVWKALRQEGFTRLAERFALVRASADPVHDLTALTAAYIGTAMDHPDLYRIMFDETLELEDHQAVDATLGHLVQAARRGRDTGRFRAGIDPRRLATQSWVVGHGLVSLVTGGCLSPRSLDDGAAMLTALFIGAGDRPDGCRASVEAGWRHLSAPMETDRPPEVTQGDPR
ncbi:TetR/AcrR family transcriptional regulator [Spongiactinospora rosea]|nr:TetR-like C-terminal domain-containing protein [Spongiactinospora rosea]